MAFDFDICIIFVEYYGVNLYCFYFSEPFCFILQSILRLARLTQIPRIEK